MDRFSSSLVLCAIFVLHLHFSAAQNLHVVGDGMGWTVPPNPSAYADWASSRTFEVGDVLQFNFTTNQHDVLRVPQLSYTACSRGSGIGDIISTGPVNVTLDSAGDRYYICTISNHCQEGQRLAVSVASSTRRQGSRRRGRSASSSPSLAAGFLLSALSVAVALVF